MIANGDSVRLSQSTGRSVRLVYVSDQSPGIRRQRTGSGFRYLNSRGKTVRSPRVLSRIRWLAIPPAWEDVWICSNPQGHLQATGRDARGRKQYIYHAAWQTGRNCEKFRGLRQFGKSLPKLRRAVKRQIASREFTREKVLAAIVLLLDETMVRVGNEEYVRQNDSFGLTTLRDRHAQANGQVLRMRFRGKSGIQHDVRITHRRLARIVRQCQELPGQRLFQYNDESGKVRPVTSGDVNDYLRRLSGEAFTAKDFRTWRATSLVLESLRRCCGPALSEQEKKQAVKEALQGAAAALGNTMTVCRKYYVHPLLLDAFLADRLGALLAVPQPGKRGLSAAEQALLGVLKRLPANGF